MTQRTPDREAASRATGAGTPSLAGTVPHRAEIDQATGLLAEQLGVRITDAFVRLRAYAYVNDLQLVDVARDIVARCPRLFPDRDLSLGTSREAPADVHGAAAALLVSWKE
ncbi:MAG TPA: ANTAR domain-containing protein [Trebonia sp.]